MENGLLHLHSLLRWIVLILLLLSLFQAIGANKAVKKTSLWLLIASHITLLIGLYQYFTGAFGLKLFQNNGVAAVMKMLIRNENDGVLIPIPQYPLCDPCLPLTSEPQTRIHRALRHLAVLVMLSCDM